MDILITIIALGLLVFIHELGHFLAARYFGVKIETFSLGIGPKIFKYERNGTIYALSLIPLGGYCSMKGEHAEMEEQQTISNNDSCHVEERNISRDSSQAQNDNMMQESDSFHAKKWWERLFIVLAGPVFNLLLAWLLIILSFSIGRTYSDISPIIELADPPYHEFFQQNDIIIEVNGKEIRSYTDIFRNIKEGEDNTFLIQRFPLPTTPHSFFAGGAAPPTKNEWGVVGGGQEIYIFIKDIAEFYEALSPKTSNIIGDVSPGLPAWKAGLKAGDKILEVNHTEVNNWHEIRDAIAYSPTENITLKIEREGRINEVSMLAEANILSDTSQRMIGITQYLDLTFHEKSSLLKSVAIGTITTFSFVYYNYRTLFMIFQSPAALKSSVGGPVMLYYMTSHTAKRGLSDLLLLVALISILLMIMNLLPLPVFDGGHIIFFLYEGIRKKAIPFYIQFRLQQVGFVLIVFLMCYVFYSDLSKVAQKYYSEKTTIDHGEKRR